MIAATLESAHALVCQLVRDFSEREANFCSPSYSEAQVRVDFIDKLWCALGWDVRHEQQKNPYAQEVKVEDPQTIAGRARRADYAFHIAPNYRDPRFFCEAKKPAAQLKSDADAAFQTIRYGWSAGTPLAVLTNFEQLQILDCRAKPDVSTALARSLRLFHYKEWLNREAFAELYYLFSREAFATGTHDEYVARLPARKKIKKQTGPQYAGHQAVDAAFLMDLEGHRETLAKLLKAADPHLDGDTLTELVPRILDRLIFLRFLEDKLIETEIQVHQFSRTAGDQNWAQFVAASRKLDRRYNGTVFKPHPVLDAPGRLSVDDAGFGDLCENLSHARSPYDFNAIPIHILGSIYERFLGKVIVTTGAEVDVQEKPEVRKAGGVYYTPEYIVRYICEQTVGRMIHGKSPAQIAKLRFADIACGSGSFLLGIYDVLLRAHGVWYNEHRQAALAENLAPPNKSKRRRKEFVPAVVEHEGVLRLTLEKRREILINNIFGVDLDPQAAIVAQLSLYLKLLEDETTATARQHYLDFHEALLPSLSGNIICGNSLIGTDILFGQFALSAQDERTLKPMDFESVFPQVFPSGVKDRGFDAIIGNPPYLHSAGQALADYYAKRYTLSEYQTDYYVYFIERALGLVKSAGTVGMIVSDSWLKGKHFSRLRGHILTQCRLRNITVFDYPPFKGATIENSIFVLDRASPVEKLSVARFTEPGALNEATSLSRQACIDRGLIDVMASPDIEQTIKNIERSTKPLSAFCLLNRGVHAYRIDGYGRSKFSDGPQTKRDRDERVYHATSKLDATYFPEIKGKHLGRYTHTLEGTYISYGDWLAECRSPEFFMPPKLAIRKIVAPKLVCTFIRDPAVLDQSIYIAVARRDDSSEISLLFLLGVLASAVGGFYIIRKHSIYDALYPWFTKEQLANFPIPALDMTKTAARAKHDRMVELVEALISTKKEIASAANETTRSYFETKAAGLDRQIDDLAYDLYELTPEERALIEGSRK